MNLDEHSETTVVIVKIIGALIAFFSFRWLLNIFKGKDGHLDKKEFKELVALVFFVAAATYIIYKEGTRNDLTHEVYGVSYLAVIFGSLIAVLHLENSLELILKIFQAARGMTITTTETEKTKTETVKKDGEEVN